MRLLCEVRDILISLIVLIISQGISKHVVQLKYIQFFVNYTLIKLKKERNTRATPKEAEASGITSHTRHEAVGGRGLSSPSLWT